MSPLLPFLVLRDPLLRFLALSSPPPSGVEVAPDVPPLSDVEACTAASAGIGLGEKLRAAAPDPLGLRSRCLRLGEREVVQCVVFWWLRWSR